MIFTLNIIPKQVLHDLVTNHQHSKVKTFGTEDKIAKAHYICTIEDELATSPFIREPEQLFHFLSPVFTEQKERSGEHVYIQEHSAAFLRGPPSC